MATFRDPKADALARIDVLAGASPRQLREICRLTTQVQLPAGSVLCTQGTRGREVFLLIDGHVGVSRDDLPVAVACSGSIIGELAVLDRTVRSATASALSEVNALVLSTAEFDGLLEGFPAVAARIHAIGAERRLANNARQVA